VALRGLIHSIRTAHLSYARFNDVITTEERSKPMDTRVDEITLAVEDIERALGFHRALDFESKSVVATEFTGDDTRRAQPRGQWGFGVVSGYRELDRRPPSDAGPWAGLASRRWDAPKSEGGGVTVAIR
jgi:hypothetical protein